MNVLRTLYPVMITTGWEMVLKVAGRTKSGNWFTLNKGPYT